MVRALEVLRRFVPMLDPRVGGRRDGPGGRRSAVWRSGLTQTFRRAPTTLAHRFRERGYHRSDPFFPHRAYRIPKAGPDGFKLAERTFGECEPEKLWELVLFAEGDVVRAFPASLFRDGDLVWHRQHFGRDGHVAFACLYEASGALHVLGLMSDTVQRISRRRDYKARIEKRFRGWPSILLNAVAGFALDRGLREVRIPMSGQVMEHTDPGRTVGPELFVRVYDRTPRKRFRVDRSGRWWIVDLEENRDRVVELLPATETRSPGPTVCVCHDVERHLGHPGGPRAGAAERAERARRDLARILDVEAASSVRSTYHVVGELLPEVRDAVEAGGHSLGFHSFDHDLGRRQLVECREVDYRLRGYRAPQSRMTRELRGPALLRHNFEWLASSAASLGVSRPEVRGRMARVPILTDDHGLHTGDTTYAAWRRRLLDAVRGSDFVAIGLHDCYARHWLDDYSELLARLADVARIRTLDEVVDELYLSAAV